MAGVPIRVVLKSCFLGDFTKCPFNIVVDAVDFYSSVILYGDDILSAYC